MGKRRALVLALVHVAIFAHLLHWQISGKTLSPLEPSEAMYTIVEGTLNAGFILFALSLLSTLVFGRFFCGWACHVVALQDLSAWILKKLGIRPRPLRSRLLVFVPLLAGLYLFFWPRIWNAIQGAPSPQMHLEMTKTAFWETFPGPWITAVTFLCCGFLIVYLLGAKGFCTYACPYGGFFGVLDRFSPGRIVVSDACKGCGHCTAVCTSNVQVHREIREYGMVVDPGCMKCQDCVSVCPEGALSFGFAKPPLFAKRKRKLKPEPGLAGRNTILEELLLVVTFAVALFALRGFPDHLFAGTARLWIGDEVPLLLAWGLSAMAAFSVLQVKHLALEDEASFLGAATRSGGELTKHGKRVALGLGIFICLIAVALGIQFAHLKAYRAADRVLKTEATPDEAIAAESDLALALRFRPQDPFLHLQRARVLGRAGRIGEAVGPSIRAAELAPKNPVVLLNLKQLAFALYNAGEPGGAADLLAASLEREPDDSTIACALAEALASAGRKSDALSVLDRFLARHPEARNVIETRTQIAGE